MKEKVWPTFAKLVKLSNADRDGWCTCFTCGRRLMWNDPRMNAGHFRGRQASATRFHRKNVQCQCCYCNKWGAGEQAKFAKRLDEKYGEGTADELTRLSNITYNFTIGELLILEDGWKDELRQLGHLID